MSIEAKLLRAGRQLRLKFFYPRGYSSRYIYLINVTRFTVTITRLFLLLAYNSHVY